MTIKELEEAMKEAAAKYKSLVAVLNELQEKESNLEADIEDLQDELDALRAEDLDFAESECRFAREKFDNLKDEYNKRIRLSGSSQVNPVVFRCG